MRAIKTQDISCIGSGEGEYMCLKCPEKIKIKLDVYILRTFLTTEEVPYFTGKRVNYIYEYEVWEITVDLLLLVSRNLKTNVHPHYLGKHCWPCFSLKSPRLVRMGGNADDDVDTRDR